MPERRRLLRSIGLTIGTFSAGCVSAPTGATTETEAQTVDDATGSDGGGGDGSNADGHHHEETDADHHHHDTIPTEPVGTAEVAMVSDDGHHFDPHVVWITPGGTVTWTLESGAHTTTAYHPDNDRPLRVPEAAAAWDSGVLDEAGASVERTFDVQGVHDYFCIPHEAMGMIGSVVVGHPDSDGQPGLAPPQEALPIEAQRALDTRNDTVSALLDGDDDDH